MKQCGSCTKCCEGWLAGNAYAHQFYPGVPCAYLDNGCTIYKSRPEKPCKTFVCEWLVDESIPAYMQPNVSGAIIIKHDDHVEMIECDPPLRTQALEWFLTAYISGKYDNITYRIHNHPRNIRTEKK
mgnify:CR=1 FL=1